MEAVLPQYFDQLDAVQVPVPNAIRDKLGLPRDQPLFLNPKLPYASLNLWPPLWDLVNDPNGLNPQTMSQTLAPFFGSWGPMSVVPGAKVALEYMTGHQLGLNRPMDFQRASSNDWRHSNQDAPFYAKYIPKPLQHRLGIVKNKQGRLIMPASNKYFLDQMATPFITNWGSSIAPSSATPAEQDKSRANTISWLTGIRLMPVDMHKLSKNQAYGLKNMLEARQSDLRSRGLELTDHDEEILDETRDFIEVAKEIDDENYFQLYGEERGGG
jgi:hypothetical protein